MSDHSNQKQNEILSEEHQHNLKAKRIVVLDGSGNQITSFGGGTQYTEGDTDTTFTGTILLVEGAADTAETLKQPTTPSDTQPISHDALTELAAAINSNQVDIAIKASDLDLMLGTDFSAVFGVNTLLTTTQADTRANTTDTFTVTAFGQVFNGTTWDRMRGDATNGILVNLGSNNDTTTTSAVSGSLDHGSNLDIDTTAEQITSTSFAAKFGVTVKSDPTNTDTVWIGNSDVTAGTTAATDGIPLEPGESITLPVNNPNLLYAIGSSANNKVYWTAV